MKIEGDHIFSLSSTDVVAYQHPGAQVPVNCTPNSCSAAGPAQFTTGRDGRGSTSCSGCGLSSCPNAWASYSGAVLQAVTDGRTPNVCNLKDSIYAASKKLKNDSRTLANDKDWTYTDVYKAAQAYYGSCTACSVARSGTGAYFACQRLGMTYCDYTWQYYQNNK
jgi:hypothetical protein